jgi:hypothetical protein
MYTCHSFGQELGLGTIVLALQEVVHLNFFLGPLLRGVIDAYLHKGSLPIRQGDNASVGGTKSAVYFREGCDAFFYVTPADVHPLKSLLVVVLCSFYPRLRWAAGIPWLTRVFHDSDGKEARART